MSSDSSRGCLEPANARATKFATMVRAGIALGSNIGDRLGFLQSARDRLRERFGTSFRQSGVFETAPVDCPPGSQFFYNAVLEIGHAGGAVALLELLQAIECDLGRPANHFRNSPRSIDLDLLYFGDEVIDQPGLQVPHPRLAEREFVLRPLAEIVPELRVATLKMTVAELLARLPRSDAVKRIHDQW